MPAFCRASLTPSLAADVPGQRGFQLPCFSTSSWRCGKYENASRGQRANKAGKVLTTCQKETSHRLKRRHAGLVAGRTGRVSPATSAVKSPKDAPLEAGSRASIEWPG